MTDILTDVLNVRHSRDSEFDLDIIILHSRHHLVSCANIPRLDMILSAGAVVERKHGHATEERQGSEKGQHEKLHKETAAAHTTCTQARARQPQLKTNMNV